MKRGSGRGNVLCARGRGSSGNARNERKIVMFLIGNAQLDTVNASMKSGNENDSERCSYSNPRLSMEDYRLGLLIRILPVRENHHHRHHSQAEVVLYIMLVLIITIVRHIIIISFTVIMVREALSIRIILLYLDLLLHRALEPVGNTTVLPPRCILPRPTNRAVIRPRAKGQVVLLGTAIHHGRVKDLKNRLTPPVMTMNLEIGTEKHKNHAVVALHLDLRWSRWIVIGRWLHPS